MRRAILVLVAFGLGSHLSAQPAGASAGAEPGTTVQLPANAERAGPVSFRRDVAPAFAASCAMVSCHGGGLHPPDLAPEGGASALRRSLVGIASEEQPARRYVQPGDPAASYLVAKIEGRLVDANCEEKDCGVRMPARNPPLSEGTQAAIRAWIAQGAEDD